MPSSDPTAASPPRRFGAGILLLTAALLCVILEVAVQLVPRAAPPSAGGEMHLRLGHGERLVVRPAQPGSDLVGPAGSKIARGVLGQDLPWEDDETAATWIDPGQSYDAVLLPFLIRLDTFRVLAPAEFHNSLQIAAPDSTLTVPIQVGEDIQLKNQAVHVEAVRRWSGLLRHPTGAPTALVSLQAPDGHWVENLFVTQDAWTTVDARVAIHFAWCPSEEEAQAAAAHKFAKMQSARWGVQEGGSINWFNTFTPGTGAQLQDGTTVTLEAVDETHPAASGPVPAIQVRIAKSGTEESQWIIANAAAPEALVLFENPSVLDTVFALYAWRDGASAVAAFRTDRSSTTVLAEGESWRPPEFGYGLRLDQVMAQGIPVLPTESTVDEVVLRTPDRTMRLRQGETVPWGMDRISFLQDVRPAQTRCDLSLVGEDHKTESVSLGPGEVVRTHGLILAFGAADPKRGDIVVLTVSTPATKPFRYLGMALVFLGLAGVLYILAQKRRRRKAGGAFA